MVAASKCRLRLPYRQNFTMARVEENRRVLQRWCDDIQRNGCCCGSSRDKCRYNDNASRAFEWFAHNLERWASLWVEGSCCASTAPAGACIPHIPFPRVYHMAERLQEWAMRQNFDEIDRWADRFINECCAAVDCLVVQRNLLQFPGTPNGVSYDGTWVWVWHTLSLRRYAFPPDPSSGTVSPVEFEFFAANHDGFGVASSPWATHSNETIFSDAEDQGGGVFETDIYRTTGGMTETLLVTTPNYIQHLAHDLRTRAVWGVGDLNAGGRGGLFHIDTSTGTVTAHSTITNAGEWVTRVPGGIVFASTPGGDTGLAGNPELTFVPEPILSSSPVTLAPACAVQFQPIPDKTTDVVYYVDGSGVLKQVSLTAPHTISDASVGLPILTQRAGYVDTVPIPDVGGGDTTWSGVTTFVTVEISGTQIDARLWTYQCPYDGTVSP